MVSANVKYIIETKFLFCILKKTNKSAHMRYYYYRWSCLFPNKVFFILNIYEYGPLNREKRISVTNGNPTTTMIIVLIVSICCTCCKHREIRKKPISTGPGCGNGRTEWAKDRREQHRTHCRNK